MALDPSTFFHNIFTFFWFHLYFGLHFHLASRASIGYLRSPFYLLVFLLILHCCIRISIFLICMCGFVVHLITFCPFSPLHLSSPLSQCALLSSLSSFLILQPMYCR
ncbi:hypothetical protein CPB86DRAFT_41294 [Serendipita vermifera]|nr:hypothetical protein CPB86DRAFT_41294 [Serendipita vermifera]